MVEMQNDQRYIDRLGRAEDADIDLVRAALDLAACQNPGRDHARYLNHSATLIDNVAQGYSQMCDAGAANDCATRLAALKRELADHQGYAGDDRNYEDIHNADLMHVIDRRKGMPVALAILYIHVARGQGWVCQGLNFPGHFIIRLVSGSERLIVDPFNRANVLQAPDLRAIIKQVQGEDAELSADYYEPVSNRETLIRLQNNVKLRQIEMADYQRALASVQAMQAIAPDDHRLALDAGVVYARTNHPQAAIKALEFYIDNVDNDKDRRDANILLRHIRGQFS